MEEQAKRFLRWEAMQYPSTVSSSGWVQVPVEGQFVLGQQVKRWVQVSEEKREKVEGKRKKVEEKRRKEKMRAKLDHQIEGVRQALKKEAVKVGGGGGPHKLNDLKQLLESLKRMKKAVSSKKKTVHKQQRHAQPKTDVITRGKIKRENLKNKVNKSAESERSILLQSRNERENAKLDSSTSRMKKEKMRKTRETHTHAGASLKKKKEKGREGKRREEKKESVSRKENSRKWKK